MGRRVKKVSHRAVPVVLLAWLVVAVPLSYGIYQTLVKSAKFFTG
ncbi:MAG: MFS transporter small subunit [Angustibacter sp.]